jgi:hypothetical protein
MCPRQTEMLKVPSLWFVVSFPSSPRLGLSEGFYEAWVAQVLLHPGSASL